MMAFIEQEANEKAEEIDAKVNIYDGLLMWNMLHILKRFHHDTSILFGLFFDISKLKLLVTKF